MLHMQAEMIGSDVVIAGMVGEQCFAYSYYLTAKEQCNYEGGQVCFLCPIQQGGHTTVTCNGYMSDLQKRFSLLESSVPCTSTLAGSWAFGLCTWWSCVKKLCQHEAEGNDNEVARDRIELRCEIKAENRCCSVLQRTDPTCNPEQR